jgi:hypothetical protein
MSSSSSSGTTPSGTAATRVSLTGLLSLAFLLAVSCALPGCTETTAPPSGGAGDGLGDFQGEIDPGAGTVVFHTLEVPVTDGLPVRVQLVGRFVLCRDVARCPGIVLAVAVRNIDTRTLYAPGQVVLSDFNPSSVHPWSGNPDWTTCPEDSIPPDSTILSLACRYGYDYSGLLGPDGALTPGETSGEKIWVFVPPPEGGSFSFAARAQFALAHDGTVIAGRFFWDANENGVRDPDEGPFGGGSVTISGPGIEGRTVQVDENAGYSIPVKEQGLYTLLATPPPTFGFAPVKATTPNPLEVLIVNGESFLHADFGWANDLPPKFPAVFFADTGDSLRLAPYTLSDARLEGRILFLNVSFSGCGPDHPFQLYMVGGFMESNPVQARLVLSHDDHGELCDAFFSRALGFDVGLILAKNNGAPVLLRFVDWHGETHTFLLNP